MLSFSGYNIGFVPFWAEISELYSSSAQGNVSINLVISLHDHSRDYEVQNRYQFSAERKLPLCHEIFFIFVVLVVKDTEGNQTCRRTSNNQIHSQLNEALEMLLSLYC